MNGFHENHNGHGPNRDISIESARSAVRETEKKYGALISAARKEWEARFAGRDPADACVSVRISAGQALEEYFRTRELDPMFRLAARPTPEKPVFY
jgi:hypothetical protein